MIDQYDFIIIGSIAYNPCWHKEGNSGCYYKLIVISKRSAFVE